MSALIWLGLLGCREPLEPYDPELHVVQREELRVELQRTLGDAYDSPVPDMASADLVNGRHVYNRSCAGCHGPNGLGDGHRRERTTYPPANLVAEERYFSEAAEYAIVVGGSEATGMPAWSRYLKPADIRDSYGYVLQLRQEEREREAAEAAEAAEAEG